MVLVTRAEVVVVTRTKEVLVTRTYMILVTRTEVILVTTTEMVLDALVHSPSDHLTRLLARESFIEFSRRESLRLYMWCLLK